MQPKFHHLWNLKPMYSHLYLTAHKNPYTHSWFHPLHSKDHSSPESYHDSNLMISYLVHLWKFLCFARIGKEKNFSRVKSLEFPDFDKFFGAGSEDLFFLLGNFFTKSRFWQVTSKRSCTTKGFYGFEDKIGHGDGGGWLRNHWGVGFKKG